MSKVIEYKKEFLDLIKDLTDINNKIRLQKEGDKIVVRRADEEVTIAYMLDAPINYFNIEDELGFYNYTDFYGYLKALQDPKIKLDNNKLILDTGSEKVDYILTNPDSTGKSPQDAEFTNVDFEFKLSVTDLDVIRNMIGQIKASRAKITTIDNNKVSIRIYNSLHDNSLVKTFDIKNLSDFSENVEFTIFSDIFLQIPAKRDYVINVINRGFMKVSLQHEAINLNIFTGRVKS